MDQQGKVASPAHGQLNREIKYLPALPARAFVKQVRPSCSASACSFSTLKLNLVLTHGIPFPRRRPFIYTVNRHRVSLEFIVPRSCIPMTFTTENPPTQVYGSSQASSSNGCYFFRYHYGPVFACLSFPHPLLVYSGHVRRYTFSFQMVFFYLVATGYLTE